MSRGPAIDGYALGLRGWQQPVASAPAVVDGVHLRWSFDPGFGIPWHGYWVLRCDRSARGLDREAERRPSERQPRDDRERDDDDVDRDGMSTATTTSKTIGDGSDDHDGGTLSVMAPAPALIPAGVTHNEASPRRNHTEAPRLGRDPGVVGRALQTPELQRSVAACAWATLTSLGAPIRLPVTHPNYPPTAGKIPDIDADAALAKIRIHYGDAALPFQADADGDSTFAQLRPWLLELVEGGPKGPPMRQQRLPDQAFDDDGSPAIPQAQLDGRPILDWLALAALDPATAQLLGLYAIDTLATPGQRYDYLVLADFDGAIASYGDPVDWLRQSLAGRSGRWADDGVHGCWFRDVVVAGRPALTPPGDVWGCPLRGEMRPVDGSLRKVEDATRVIGVRWQAQRGEVVVGGRGDRRTFAEPLQSYHVWRGYCGDGEQPGKVDALRPLVGEGVGPVGALPTPIVAVEDDAPRPGRGVSHRRRRSQPRMHLHDVVARDGHYVYLIARSDVFGRYSAPSGPAAFRPLPDDGLGPRFWARREAVDGALSATAIEVRSDVAPPPPQGLVAVLHDPEDPNDVSYQTPSALMAAMVEDGASKAEAQAAADALAATPYWQWSSHVGTPPGLALEVSWRWSWASSRRTPGVHGFRVELEREVGGKPVVTTLAEVPFAAGPGDWAAAKTFEVRRDGEGRAATGVGLSVLPTAPSALLPHGFAFDRQALRPGQDQVLLQDDGSADGPVYVLADVFEVVDDAGAVPKALTWLRVDGAPQVGNVGSCGWAIGEAGLEWRVFLPVDALFWFANWREFRAAGRVRVVAVGVQASRPESAGAGPAFVERVRRRWPKDAPRLVIDAPAGGLMASAPDAQGRSFVEVPWRLEGVDSLPLPEGLTVEFGCLSDLEIYAAEAEAQPRAVDAVSAGPGTLRAELLPDGVVVTAAEADAVRGFFERVREFALVNRVEVGAGFGGMTLPQARGALGELLTAGPTGSDLHVWRSRAIALRGAVESQVEQSRGEIVDRIRETSHPQLTRAVLARLHGKNQVLQSVPCDASNCASSSAEVPAPTIRAWCSIVAVISLGGLRSETSLVVARRTDSDELRPVAVSKTNNPDSKVDTVWSWVAGGTSRKWLITLDDGSMRWIGVEGTVDSTLQLNKSGKISISVGDAAGVFEA